MKHTNKIITFAAAGALSLIFISSAVAQQTNTNFPFRFSPPQIVTEKCGSPQYSENRSEFQQCAQEVMQSIYEPACGTREEAKDIKEFHDCRQKALTEAGIEQPFGSGKKTGRRGQDRMPGRNNLPDAAKNELEQACGTPENIDQADTEALQAHRECVKDFLTKKHEQIKDLVETACGLRSETQDPATYRECAQETIESSSLSDWSGGMRGNRPGKCDGSFRQKNNGFRGFNK